MGKKGLVYTTPHNRPYLAVDSNMYETNKARLDDFKFHESWDWLMPIIQKIERLDTLDKDKDFNKQLDRVICKFIYTDIKTMYKAVIKFIKWYNENNKSN